MKPKQRILAAIKGEKVDRIPWSPFLAYFWESLPSNIQQKGQTAFLEEIGADPMLRGCAFLYRSLSENYTVSENTKGDERFVTYNTPVGILNERYVYTANTKSWFLVDHPVKTQEDFKILTWLHENIILKPDMDDFNQLYQNFGDDGMLIPVFGGLKGKSSFQSLLEHWVGTEELVYALADYQDTVEECLEAMKKVSFESVRISVQSPAEVYTFWEDSSTTNISPTIYHKYIAPEIKRYSQITHDAGKFIIQHACGHLKELLPLMPDTMIDMVESVSAPPTGNIQPWKAKEILPESIGIIGGIEPTFFLNCSLNELDVYVTELLSRMGKTKFILANADSCPPGVDIEKFKAVSEIVKREKC